MMLQLGWVVSCYRHFTNVNQKSRTENSLIWISVDLCIRSDTDGVHIFCWIKKMVLHLTQRALAFVGFFAGKQIFRYKCLHTLVSLLILINLLTFVSTSVVYIVIHLQMGDIENVLQACYQVTGTVPLLASFFTIMYHKEKVAKLIDAFQKIFNRCTEYWVSTCAQIEQLNLFYFFAGAGKSSAIGFMRADRLSEIFITVAMSAILGGFIASSIASVAIDAIIDFTRDGYIEAKDLFLPFKMRCDVYRTV